MTTKSTMQNNAPDLLAISITMRMPGYNTERIAQ
jgi:hypothetical protein